MALTAVDGTLGCAGMVGMRIGQRIVFSVLMTLCALLVFEGLARMVSSPPEIRDGARLPPDPDLLWRQPVGARDNHGTRVRINTLGMRGPELEKKRRDECRVVSVGDSSVFGFLVAEDESYTAVACRTQACTPMLLASPGYSSVQSLVWLERVGSELQPDWVLIGNLWSDQSVVGFQDKDLVRDYSVFRRRWQWTWLGVLRRSVLFNQLRLAYLGDSKQERRDVAWQRGWNQGDKGEPRVPIEDYAENLAALTTLSHSLGAHVAFVGLAKKAEIDGAQDELAVQYRSVLRQAAELANAPYIDAKTVWLESGRSSTALFADFLHPSSEGHFLLGKAIAERINLEQGCD